MDAILKPQGFIRKGLIWNRSDGRYTDVIDFQISRFDSKVTVNLGILDRDVYRKCWSEEASKFVEEVDCTVRKRLGILLDNHDTWWQLEDESAQAEMLNALGDVGVEFLSGMHSESAMERFFLSSSEKPPRYPPEAVYLAIIQLNQGKTTKGCDILSRLFENTSAGWHRRIKGILEQYCG